MKSSTHGSNPVPSICCPDKTANNFSGETFIKSVNVDGVVPILVEALKEAIAKIETLETKVAALESS